MPSLDILANSAFQPIALTRAARLLPYKPQTLGLLNIFDVERIRDTRVTLRRINGKITLIPTTERGGDPVLGQSDSAADVYLKTPRLAKRQRKQAHEIQNMRSLDNNDELATVQDEVTRIQASQRRDMELTHEFHRLGAVQGKLLDTDGTTLVDFYKSFGIQAPAPINFKLNVATTDVRAVCKTVTRAMRKAGQGAILPSTQITALAGDNFYDMLVGHPTVKDTYRYQEGQQLRTGVPDAFEFGGINWINYRGTDDGSSVAIDPDTARFFPVGAPDVFGVAFSPFEAAEFVNTPGEDVYSIVVWDMERRFWWQPEIYSYPLHYCRLPEVLLSATKQ